MRRYSWLVVWILLGCLITWLATSGIGKVVVAFALSYLATSWWRNRHARTTYR